MQTSKHLRVKGDPQTGIVTLESMGRGSIEFIGASKFLGIKEHTSHLNLLSIKVEPATTEVLAIEIRYEEKDRKGNISTPGYHAFLKIERGADGNFDLEASSLNALFVPVQGQLNWNSAFTEGLSLIAKSGNLYLGTDEESSRHILNYALGRLTEDALQAVLAGEDVEGTLMRDLRASRDEVRFKNTEVSALRANLETAQLANEGYRKALGSTIQP